MSEEFDKNQRINDLKDKYNKSNKYALYLDYEDIGILFKYIDNQQKEIEEKTTILLVGAEKVKQLEKGNRSLMESRIKWKNRYYKEKEKNKECISKDKIIKKIKELEGHGTFDAVIVLRNLLKED